jgi:hypothetical protein
LKLEDIAISRLSSQNIQPGFAADSPDDVLTSLGAIQAQDYPASLWAIGLRCRESTTMADVEAAIVKRTISRTWLMRGTLHFASSQDVHWMLGLFAPRLLKTAIARDKHLGLSDDMVKKAEDLFATALKGNRRLTRGQMYDVLEEGGIQIGGTLGYHLLYRAAWDGVICFGPREGKRPTFELLHERVESKRELSNERALAELASRYFTSHGPATIKDYLWWSGLKASDAKAGIAGVSPKLIAEEMGGTTFYMAKPPKSGKASDLRRVHLLPAFDEYLVGYSDRSAMLGDPDTQRMLKSGKIFLTNSNGIFLPVVVADGKVVGTWRARDEKKNVAVTIRPFTKFDKELTDGVEKAAGRYGAFLGAPATVSFDD